MIIGNESHTRHGQSRGCEPHRHIPRLGHDARGSSDPRVEPIATVGEPISGATHEFGRQSRR